MAAATGGGAAPGATAGSGEAVDGGAALAAGTDAVQALDNAMDDGLQEDVGAEGDIGEDVVPAVAGETFGPAGAGWVPSPCLPQLFPCVQTHFLLKRPFKMMLR